MPYQIKGVRDHRLTYQARQVKAKSEGFRNYYTKRKYLEYLDKEYVNPVEEYWPGEGEDDFVPDWRLARYSRRY